MAVVLLGSTVWRWLVLGFYSEKNVQFGLSMFSTKYNNVQSLSFPVVHQVRCPKKRQKKNGRAQTGARRAVIFIFFLSLFSHLAPFSSQEPSESLSWRGIGTRYSRDERKEGLLIVYFIINLFYYKYFVMFWYENQCVLCKYVYRQCMRYDV